jgi:ABC-type sugar transport system permease subunit
MFFHHLIQTIFLLAGVTSLLAAVLNWKWFFNTKNAEPIVGSLGGKKARWLYGTIGIILIAAAIGFYYQIRGL